MMGLFNARTVEGPVGNYFSGKEPGTSKVGEKLFSEELHAEERHRQPDPAPDADRHRRHGRAAGHLDREGVLKNLVYDRVGAPQKKEPTPTTINMSLVMEGGGMSMDQMIKTTKRGLLVTFFWYIRGVDNETLLNTGMTRDGLFLIENGEIAGPVQNFRWNMSPIVGYNNITAIGEPCRFTPASPTTAADGAGAAGDGSRTFS